LLFCVEFSTRNDWVEISSQQGKSTRQSQTAVT
jgi:hypothetical protein